MIKISIQLLVIFILFLLIYLDNKLIKVSKYKIKNSKLSNDFNNFKIIHLSDYHNHKLLGKGNNILINKINKENPNVIVMTGDMVNKYDKNFTRFIDLAEALSKKYKIYYIIGNHEQRLKEKDLNYILSKLKDFNITVLNDEKAVIKEQNSSINIYGINLPLGFYRIKTRPSNLDEVLDSVLKKTRNNEYNILLAHNPLYFDYYSKYNIDLILSGHVHGGMIRFPFGFGLLSPERRFFPKYSCGIYEKNNKKLIVSRGMGHSRMGIRIFNMPEIISITLKN